MATTASTVVFRRLTPIFSHQIEGDVCFTHSGKYGDAQYEIRLRPYLHDPACFADVTEYSTPDIRKILTERGIHVSDGLGLATHCLLVDIRHPSGSIRDFTAGTHECAQVQQAVVDALSLNCSAGLTWHETYC